ncbi:GntR family transcriptional regulator [Rhodobacterales bacterium HKCCSP123]|nr:GntR family transcriptional regulator [Rhodobacterales bacterium HKCCSP123]
MARVPLYRAAETELIRRIESGEWEVGRRLPNEFVLAEEFRVSQGTMRRALMSLEGMGYLDRKPGRGTLVSLPAAGYGTSAPAAALSLKGTDGAPLALEVFRSRAGTRGASPGEADLFGAARLSVLERTLTRDGTRAALDEIAVPEAMLPALKEEAAIDLADLLTDAGLPPYAITDSIAATVTTMSESVALSCDRYTALLVLTRTATDAEGHIIARQTLRLVSNGITCGP